MATRLTRYPISPNYGPIVNRYEISMLMVLGAVSAVIGAALFFEHVDGQSPCPLCLTQRIWFMVTGLAAFVALIDHPGRRVYPLLVVLSALAGAGFSLRQLYLQQLPPELAPACGPGLDYMMEVWSGFEVLSAMLSGTGDCAAVGWSLLGLSMAGWALVTFIGIVGVAVYPFLKR